MSPLKLYSYAKRHASFYNTPYKEDMIQDAVISAWLTLQKRKTNSSYIQDHIVKKLKTAWKRYASWDSGPLEEWQHPTTEMEVLSLPLKGRERLVAELMLQNNFELSLCAEAINLSKSQTYRIWARAKTQLREAQDG